MHGIVLNPFPSTGLENQIVPIALGPCDFGMTNQAQRGQRVLWLLVLLVVAAIASLVVVVVIGSFQKIGPLDQQTQITRHHGRRATTSTTTRSIGVVSSILTILRIVVARRIGIGMNSQMDGF